MAAIEKFAPTGVAGDVTRPDVSTVESIYIDGATETPTAFGVPVYVEAGKARTVADSYGGTIYGVLTRSVPSIAASSAEPDAPAADFAQGVLVEGYVLVKVGSGTPVRGARAYIRGGLFVADNTGPNDIETSAVWAADGKDGNDIAELFFTRLVV